MYDTNNLSCMQGRI